MLGNVNVSQSDKISTDNSQIQPAFL